jgi:Reverse transcriptase (RNA-dependent DNA polymerase)
MTMALNNAGDFFQRLVNNVYAGLTGRSKQAYLDDIAVGSDTPAQHIVDVRDMLQQKKGASLRLKLAKCSFGKAEVELLGHNVKFGEDRQKDKYREYLQHFAEPTNASELLRFPGLL